MTIMMTMMTDETNDKDNHHIIHTQDMYFYIW
jgi:hypothetical protein